MKGYRHTQIVLGLAFVFSGSTIFANYVACPQAKQGVPVSPTQAYCTGPHPDDLVFNPCGLTDLVNNLHRHIQNTLTHECAVEKAVEEIEQKNEYRKMRAFTSGRELPHPEPLDDETRMVMHRLKPSKYSDPSAADGLSEGSAPLRTDDCLSSHIREYLANDVANRCQPAFNDIRSACNMEKAKANNEIKKSSQQLVSTKGGQRIKTTSPLETVRTELLVTQEQLQILKQANDKCVNAITQLRDNDIHRCLPVFEDFFNDSERMTLLGKFCTHKGVSQSVEELIDYLNNDHSPYARMKAVSKDHINNRIREGELAVKYDELAKELIRLEALLLPDRVVAEDSGESE